MNQNWIVENLNNAFSTWNGKLTELWGLVTTSPQSFKGGAVWGVMQSLHSAMVGIGYTASQLCHRLLDDMAITVLLQTKRNHNFTNMDKDEAARVRAAWKPVIEKLPDYAYLCDEILREAQENEEENGIDLQ